MLKIGHRGNKIKELQRFLNITDDGIFGKGTERAVKKWQSKNGLVGDGIVGPSTLNLMGILSTDNTDQVYETYNGLQIEKCYLDKNEYFSGSNPEYLFIHHTAGWHNPYNTIKSWNTDNRGCVGTEFVIGGQSIKGDDNSHDGRVIQAMPPGGWGWHLGTGRSHMHKNSVGIEVNNFGWIKNGKTYVGTVADNTQIKTLKEEFRGYTSWHKYSDKQIDSLRNLIIHISNRDNINIREGLPQLIKKHGANAFDYNQDAREGKIKGLLNHTNVNRGKFDMFPQEELLDMLISL